MSSNNLLISSLFPHFHHKPFFFYPLMKIHPKITTIRRKRERFREKEDQEEEEEEEGVFLVD